MRDDDSASSDGAEDSSYTGSSEPHVQHGDGVTNGAATHSGSHNTTNDGAPTANPASSSFRACEHCRSRKVRCVRTSEHGPCTGCARTKTACVQLPQLPKRKRKSTAVELKSRVDTLERQLQEALSASKRQKVDNYGDHSRYGSPAPQQGTTSYEPNKYVPTLPPPPPPPISYQSAAGALPPPPPPSYAHTDAPYGRPAPAFEHPPHPGPLHKFMVGNSQHTTGGSGKYSNERRLPQPNYSRSLPSLAGTPQPAGHPVAVSPFASSAASSLGPAGPVSAVDRSASLPQGSDESSPDRPSGSRGNDASSTDDQAGPGEPEGEKLIGPIAAIDQEFFELCVRRTMEARENSQTPQPPWSRFTSHSTDEALPIYRVSFREEYAVFAPFAVCAADTTSQVFKEYNTLYEEYGQQLLDTFDAKLGFLYHADTVQIRSVQDGLAGIAKKRLMSYTAAAMSLAALCVESWPLKKRLVIANSLYLKGGYYMAREFCGETMAHLKSLLMLSDFPQQPDGSMAVINTAFELRLNIDPGSWQISAAEKTERRRLWWILLLKERLVALRHPRPTLPSDCYDTQVPEVKSREDEAVALMLDVSGLISDINSAFYSVKGARMVYDNVHSSRILAQHFCERVTAVRERALKLFPAPEHIPDPVLGMSAATVMLHIEYCTVMMLRPFFNSRNLTQLEKLELKRRSAEATCAVVAVLRRMPDSFFDQHWFPSCCIILHGAAVELLRASVQGPEDDVKMLASEALDAFVEIGLRNCERWHVAKMLVPIMRLRATLTGKKEYAPADQLQALLSPHVLDVRGASRSKRGDGTGEKRTGGAEKDGDGDVSLHKPQTGGPSRASSQAGTPRSVPFAHAQQASDMRMGSTPGAGSANTEELSPWQQQAVQSQSAAQQRQQAMLNHASSNNNGQYYQQQQQQQQLANGNMYGNLPPATVDYDPSYMPQQQQQPIGFVQQGYQQHQQQNVATGLGQNNNMASLSTGMPFMQNDFDDFSQLLGLTTPMMPLGEYFGGWGALG